MADLKRVSPTEAKRLVDEEGYVYVDVRSVPEFEAEHPVGARNVPLMHAGPGGMAPNPEFVAVMSRRFPKDAKLVLGCKTGNRSMRAAGVLAAQGWTNVVDQRAGFDGARDPFGQLTEPGWKPAGLPCESGDGGPNGWAALKAQ
jgi:rhodanese-related sulfurtransferase